MGDCNTKHLPVDDVPDVFETLRGEKGSEITQNIHSPTAQAFSKSILPHQLRDKSHDVWLHPSVKFLSDSVGDVSFLLTTQNSGSNECHVESHSIDTTESSDVIQEFKRELLEKSLSRLDKIEDKLENVVAIVAANPLLAANTEKNAVEDTNVSAENRNWVEFDSYDSTDRLIELQKPPILRNMFPHSSSELPLDSVNCYVTASPQENLNETVVPSEILQDARVPETSNVEHQGRAETPITMDALQDQTDKILLATEPEYLKKATMTIDNPAGGSKETTGTQHIVEKHQKESTSHHLGLMCSFAERQQQELVKLQSQIEVQTKDKKDSGMFIRVAESIPLFDYRCYVDGLREDQRVRLSNILQLKFGHNLNISNRNSNLHSSTQAFAGLGMNYAPQFVCADEIYGIRALDFMSFLKKEYSAKIISYDNMYSYESPNSGPRYQPGPRLPNGLAFWILEVDEI